MAEAGFFYLFAVLAVASGAMVILARNPVHAVLFLVLAFFNAAGLFVLLGAEFLAMLLVIVYVGAVSVIFLFVVMMLDVDFAALKAGFIKNAKIGAIIGGVVLAELVVLFSYRGLNIASTINAAAPIPVAGSGVTNTAALGQILYTKYVYLFQTSGVILLVAMIGAIVLTLKHRVGVKRQSIAEQVSRDPAKTLEVVKVPTGGSVIPASKRREAAE
ncbi:NADH:ubiquinone oxidoreductase subunit J [Hyphomicrobium denitrificans 1NES1]|uniref:NADH-quinone oxidoreductase subunit J n=1 Tax=Hyphomicrobium denitrificans 1NES1 TaxID=670307 RepID=N0BA94_9HYPH|nr:NADH-quinone oxidoreductase subunit J [Hyphomicrobium denitrificans]AGK57456.1 NADH:ubiquinone oxidoreductase subunit J [Hyphomicrobium denitrificans 1NES1]